MNQRLFRRNIILPKCISYMISYYYKAGQCYILIINHDRNWFWLYGSACRQPTLQISKFFCIFIFIGQILWQLLCYGHLLFLLYAWQMGHDFSNPDFVPCRSWKLFMGNRIWYCNNTSILWVCVDILRRFLFRLWRRTISSKTMAEKPIYSRRG